MKILRIITSMNPALGGPCQGIRNSIPAMAKLGVQNEVLCFDGPGVNFIVNQGFKIHSIGPSRGPYAYCEELDNWLLRNLGNYEIIIIHGLWLYNSYGTYRVWKNMKRAGKKVPRLFVMPHGMLDPYFQTSRDRRLKAVRNWFFWKFVEEKVVNGSDGLLFTCEEELLLARKTFKPYHPKKELNVSYGIKKPPKLKKNFFTEFLKVCPSLKARPYWLFLSRIHPKKGVENLIQAYIRLKNENNKIPDLVIAGPGIQTSFGKKIIREADCQSIHFPGMLMGPAKWAAFYHCEAFVLPSHQENFGIAVVEALACTRPVLISNKVNIWREIQNGNAGLVAEDTPEGTYALLKDWSVLPESKRLIIGTDAGELFEKRFKIDQAVIKMTDCFKTFMEPATVA